MEERDAECGCRGVRPCPRFEGVFEPVVWLRFEGVFPPLGCPKFEGVFPPLV
jgi:hypothetical protein